MRKSVRAVVDTTSPSPSSTGPKSSFPDLHRNPGARCVEIYEMLVWTSASIVRIFTISHELEFNDSWLPVKPWITKIIKAPALVGGERWERSPLLPYAVRVRDAGLEAHEAVELLRVEVLRDAWADFGFDFLSLFHTGRTRGCHSSIFLNILRFHVWKYQFVRK